MAIPRTPRRVAANALTTLIAEFISLLYNPSTSTPTVARRRRESHGSHPRSLNSSNSLREAVRNVFNCHTTTTRAITMTDITKPLEMVATQAEMKDARLDLAFRDECAHLLIPLNNCRRETSSVPWKCGDLRHVYEKCQYDLHKRRKALRKEEQR